MLNKPVPIQCPAGPAVMGVTSQHTHGLALPVQPQGRLVQCGTPAPHSCTPKAPLLLRATILNTYLILI